MKPNTKDISGNFSRKNANHCKNLLCTFSLFCHFDCHYLLNNYSSGTLMAMMLRTRIEISWLKCLSLPVSIVCKSRSPDMARSRPLRLFSHSSDRFQTSKYLLGTLCLTNSDQFGDVNGKVSPPLLLISFQFSTSGFFMFSFVIQMKLKHPLLYPKKRCQWIHRSKWIAIQSNF